MNALPAYTNAQGNNRALRAAIVTALAAAAMSHVPARKALAAPGPCPTINGVMTCTGDHSAGIDADFSAVTTTTLRVENVTTNVNGIVIDERRGELQPLQNVAVQVTGTQAERVQISTVGAAGISATTLSGIGDDGADATSGVLCIGADGAEAGGTGMAGNTLGVNLTNVDINAVNGVGLRLTNAAGPGGEGGGGNACHGSQAGGLGGIGAVATITTSNTRIETVGNASNGITVSSSGGTGGRGGAGGAFRWGSRGGVGGTGGAVNVLGSADIFTNGLESLGIYAISIGGDGGNGGSSDAFGGGGDGPLGAGGGLVTVDGTFNITTLGDQSYGIGAYSIGGRGGMGGDDAFFNPSAGSGGGTANSGDVIVRSRGSIRTEGDFSSGIVAQSVAGHAGDAGGSNSIITFGAGGGSAGDGGVVTVENFGQILTGGEQAHAIFAQSIGGGGGSGGGGFSAFYSEGGDGGAGGNGGIVNITNSGQLEATGLDARGIYAQSIGGAGGDGGDSGGLIVALGGRGANTSNGALVTVVNEGDILSSAHAIFAESIGGGGGNGGDSGGWFSIGGTGGAGGAGGIVAVTNGGNLTTLQNNSSAIFAHSIGGGGGNGGHSASVGPFASIAIGGDGEEGGDAERVNVTTTGGTILTGANFQNGARGDGSHGIFAQSIGGGGGNGGFAASTAVGNLSIGIGGTGAGGGHGRAVNVDSASTIVTRGDDAHAIYAESVGGGGGSGGFAVSLAVGEGMAGAIAIGGAGGGGGDGDRVDVASSGVDLQTSGHRSYGILAQSVGGGGGNGGFAVAGALSIASPAGALALGGPGAGGGRSRDVSVESSSNITTGGDDAHGLFAQSVGGGGGSGGFAVAGAVSSSFAVTASFGGTGAAGGNAGAVSVGRDEFTTGTIRTSGDRSSGLVAQSVGGGGGSGGFSVSAGIALGTTAGLSIGGNGGRARDGDTVTVRTANTVITDGDDSHGIFAQSVGGGGGNGGFSVTGGITASGAVGASIGGTGSGGGAANTVTVTGVGDAIATSGAHSYGLFAQSVGGGGGDGGFSVAGNISQGASANFSLGGSGGNAGMSRDVFVTSTSQITTRGDDSHGLFAQSVGGGGGSGGFSVAGNITASGGSVGAALGGSGAGGGNSGRVFVTTTAEDTGVITTDGHRSIGLFAQSVGGGGGVGGFAISGGISNGPAATFALGGGGGTGAHSDTVFVNSATSIATLGNDSHGIFAQSLGGGGGSGGFAVAGSISTQAGVSAALGGNGAGGGNAQDVTVLSTGAAIETRGTHAYGIAAQSVGGGGGDGGFSVAGGIADGPSATFALGGSGNGGGFGRNVFLDSSTAVMTRGDDSHGVFAQSLGGGGGSGGFSVTGGISRSGIGASIGGSGAGGGDGGLVTLNNAASLVDTSGNHAYGVVAQSIGGGGGDGGFSVAGGINDSPSANFSLGGSGAGGGNGAAVRLTSASNIVTRGNDAHGVFAQSLGGGGGSGGFSVAGSIGTDNAQVNASIGGAGAGGGNAAAVELFNSGDAILTLGARSYGLVAQSIGGGGGDGGFSVAGSITKGPSANFSIGGGGDVGGFAGDVTLNSTGAISTVGEESHAIFAQSVGGGGGSGGFSVAGSLSGDQGSFNASVGGFGAGGGDAGQVRLGNVAALDGVLTTEGDRAYGILAQSVGGGGGDGGFSVAAGIAKGDGAKFSLGGGGDVGGNASLVSVRSANTIVTRGADAHGVFAQSVGGGGGSGGFSVVGAVATQGAAVGASIGGSGAGGGDGGDVQAESRGASITTLGERAYGIVAQSIGGGGGDGGFSVAGSINRTAAVNLSVGGSGDVGGDAGDVSVASTSDIATTGKDAHAISAQSIGGGGGSGGFSVAGSLFPSQNNNPKIDVSFGGTGAGGGDAGDVDVGAEDDFIAGDIVTLGDGANGIMALSLGGGGGDGGFSVGGGVSQSPQMTIGIGGSAGIASDGGAVRVFTGANIFTQGVQAYGVSAQSLGGGGGNGGFGIAGSATTDLTSVTASIGGKGGGGGRGSSVDVANSGHIVTMGELSYGVFAESVGGGGGDGGFSVAGTLSKPPAKQHPRGPRNLDIAIGGEGGTGNVGGDVTVSNDGRIDTFGGGSHAILAHSVGGGGGDGGFAAAGSLGVNNTNTQGVRAVFAVSVGGNGGNGNVGGDVTVENTRTITTEGEKARGIYAYSVGGGGGAGGASFSIDTAIGKPHHGSGLNVEISVGGLGGNGNDGGEVSVTNSGEIQTLGDRSDAIYAQSIGGGGGDGGEAHSVSLDFTFEGSKSAQAKKGSEWNFVAAVGGNGGVANNGGDVEVTNSGNIVTTGVNARGIVAQSVGGGGGSGGSGISGTGLDELDMATELLDLKDKKLIDIDNWAVIVGGSGGASGDGGELRVTNDGSISTFGLAATAIFVQSIGGGGGEAQNFASGTGAGGKADTGLRGKVAIGGGGGASGDGRAVQVTNTGDLQTRGDDAHGIFAQSIGGGGGVAGNVDRGLPDGLGPIPPLNIGIGLAFGQDGGNGGDGGAVTIANDGDIVTTGVGSFGIFAQSVGGGGGLAGGLGNDIAILDQQNFAGSVGGDGSGGAIQITQRGNIAVLGDAADGIFAQSDAANGTGGVVQINVAGHIDAGGAHANGIRAHSQGDLGSGNIAVTIESGSVRGGTESGAAVKFIDGADNTLTNRGEIGRLDELARVTVAGGEGNEAIENFGRVLGSMSLGGGTNTFQNLASGVFASGATVDLGALGTARNEGVWSVGASDEIANTALTGSFAQSASGTLLIDIDHLAGTADRIDVLGGSASLSGALELNPVNLTSIRPGMTQTVLVSSAGGLNASNLRLVVAPSIISQYALTTLSNSQLALSLTTDFVPGPSGSAQLTPNEAAVGNYFNTVQLAGSSPALGPTVAGLLKVTDLSQLGSIYQLMNPENYAALPLGALHSGLQFGEAMLSCKMRDGEHYFTAEGECGWLTMVATSSERDANRSANGYEREASTVSGGLQWALNDRWHVGLAAAFERDTIDANTLENFRAQVAEGRTVHVGAVLKGNFSGTTIAASLSGARGEYDARRRAFLTFGARSAPTVYQEALQFRVAHAFDSQQWYWRPMLDLGVTRVRLGSFLENGAGATNLAVDSNSETFINLRPGVELGYQLAVGDAIARLYARLAVDRFVSGGDFSVNAVFQEAPGAAGPFHVTESLDRTVRECAFGVDLFGTRGLTLRLGYAGQFSANGTSHGGTIKFVRAF